MRQVRPTPLGASRECVRRCSRQEQGSPHLRHLRTERTAHLSHLSHLGLGLAGTACSAINMPAAAAATPPRTTHGNSDDFPALTDSTGLEFTNKAASAGVQSTGHLSGAAGTCPVHPLSYRLFSSATFPVTQGKASEREPMRGGAFRRTPAGCDGKRRWCGQGQTRLNGRADEGSRQPV